ncbi:hypothetical protein [Geminocystis herdmanii]|uniref:hypothetical protein n=1 Tax=Geminocystis herdmanii TaxID=669359 RepID=UPI00034862BA|nr:hypothetical protein [Geminocystis herdmanii]
MSNSVVCCLFPTTINITSVRQKKNGEDETGGQVDKWTGRKIFNICTFLREFY